MNRQNIKVSVIMACFNYSAYLDEAVSSVLGQTLDNLELVLIDDCSTDNTLEIANRYQMQDDRVLVISLPENSGPVAARNTGIRVAKGAWLGILDSDDVALPSRFEEQMKLADSDKRLVMVGSNAISMEAKGHTIKEHKYPTSHSDLVKNLVFMRAFPPHSSMMYRRDVVQKLSGFNMKFPWAQDYDLWLRLSEIGRISSVGKPLVKIRKHERNISDLGGGAPQLFSSVVAGVCHFLRIYGCLDPSASNDEMTWQKFVTWVDRRVAEEGTFEKFEAWGDARAEYLASENRLTGTFRFGVRLMQSGHAGTLVWKKFFGSSLLLQLAREWIINLNR